MFERFKEWQMTHVLARQTRILNRIEKRYPQIYKARMAAIVQRLAIEMAMKIVLNWLSENGYAHCASCLSTKGLRGLIQPEGKQYYCAVHYPAALKEYDAMRAKATVVQTPAPVIS